MLKVLFSLFISVASTLQSEEVVDGKVPADWILTHLVNSSYDHRVRPPGYGENGESGPVNISVNLYLRSISNIDFVNMQYHLQITFRESWRDPRLSYEYMGEKLPKFILFTKETPIWMPDTFFMNEKQAHRHSIDAPNMLIRVHSDGTVLYSVRVSLVLSCPMYLQKYPMDIQTCLLDLASYAYTTDDVVYHWKEENPIQEHKALKGSLPSFDLTDVETDLCTSKTNTGEYSCLRTRFTLERQFSYYLLQVYIPSTLLVIVSWVSFWLDRGAVPARVTLGVTTLLSMTTQAAAINQKLPPVSYIKSIDVWISVCLAFIFGAVIEYAYVSHIASYIDNKKDRVESCVSHENGNEKEDEVLLNGGMNKEPSSSSYFQKVWTRMTDGADRAKMIDVKSRFVFPLAYLLFNVIYWTWYLCI